ncbi:hypothetical protein FNV43_RR03382 [Rhamnella rubrinervis]|uniref:Pentatricopeptide repeat-containing protein n=1 Tax=Rhamnella rubrinervis TaxID=2594499 RepID=A0A8K0HIS3_9ROSA|nr:hypothetical protein FNV43_RR03382 [Rhamnella rubrinervis]
MSCVRLKHLSSAIRSISNHRSVSQKTINLSVLEIPSNQCRDFKEFKKILSQMILTGFIKNKFAAKRLLQLSTNDLPFIHLDYCFQIFNVIENPDASIYNIMIIAYVRRNYPHRAIRFYKLMLYRNVGPNAYTYPFLIEACAIRQSKFEGKQMYNHVLKLGFASDAYIRSTFVDSFADCSMIKDALKVFCEGPMMGSFVWYSLLEACKGDGDEEGTKFVYSLMPEKDTIASNFMIVFFWRSDELVVEAALRCCINLAGYEDIEMGKLIHCLVVKIGIESDVELQNSLIGMYSACGQILSAQNLFNEARWLRQSSWNHMLNWYVECDFDKNAEALFESMPIKNIESWIVMMTYYSRHKGFSESLALFQEKMHFGIRLDEVSLHTIIDYLPCRFAVLDLGKCILAYSIKNGYNLWYRCLHNALQRMYERNRCGYEHNRDKQGFH